MRTAIEEYGMFIVAIIIGLFLAVGLFFFTVENEKFDTVKEEDMSISAGDNSGLAAKGKPTINVVNASIKLGDNTFNVRSCLKGAFDYEGNDITNNVKIEGSVDTSRIGQYPVTFSVVDKNGLKTVQTHYFLVSPYGLPTYNITVGEYLTTDQAVAVEGASVRITYTAFPGQRCKSFSLVDTDGKPVAYKGTIVGQTKATVYVTMPRKNIVATVIAEEIPTN